MERQSVTSLSTRSMMAWARSVGSSLPGVTRLHRESASATVGGIMGTTLAQRGPRLRGPVATAPGSMLWACTTFAASGRDCVGTGGFGTPVLVPVNEDSHREVSAVGALFLCADIHIGFSPHREKGTPRDFGHLSLLHFALGVQVRHRRPLDRAFNDVLNSICPT